MLGPLMNTTRRTMSVELGRSRGGVADLGGRTIALIRHAQCEPQVEDARGTDRIDSPLTSLGFEQAEALVIRR